MSGSIEALNQASAGLLGLLITAGWHGALALAGAWLVCMVFPGIPARARCWVWRAAYAKLFLALLGGLTVDLPLLPPATSRPASGVLAPSTALPPVDAAPAASPSLLRSSSLTPPPRTPTPSLATGLILVWFVGTLVVVARVVADARRVCGFRRSCSPIKDATLRRTCSDLCYRLGIPQLPELLDVSGEGSPVLTGALRPAVLLPEGVRQEWAAGDVRLLLAHELAHLQRRDLWWAWLPSAAQVVFWFHPGVWLAGREWRMAQEMATDQLAIKAASAPAAEYGDVILRVASLSRLTPQPGLSTVGIEETPHALRRRLAAMRVLDGPRRGAVSFSAVLVLVGVAAGLVPWRLTPAPGPEPRVSMPAPTSASERDQEGTTRSLAASPPRVGAPGSIPPGSPAAAVGGEGAASASRPTPREVARPSPASASPLTLAYGIRPGESLHYAVDVEGEEDGWHESITGQVSYTAATDAEGVRLRTQAVLHPPIHRPSVGGWPGGQLPMLGPGSRMRTGFRPPEWATTELLIRPNGRILRQGPPLRLPYSLGDLNRLAILPLPEAGQTTWQTEAEVLIPVADPFDIGRRGLGGSSGLPPWSRGVGGSTGRLGRETVRYEIVARDGDELRLKRSWRLETVEQSGGGSAYSVDGSGQLRWDSRRGVLRELNFEGIVRDRMGSRAVEFPVSLTLRRVQPSSPSGVVATPAATPVTVDSAAALRTLEGGDRQAQRRVLDALSGARVDSRRAAVAAALLPLLQDEDGFFRGAAVRALGVWGTEGSVPPLIRLMDQDPAFAVQWAAIEALGRLRDVRAAEPLAARVASGKDRAFASSALQKIGASAEGAVIPLLSHGDHWVRYEACRILAVIGTRASVSLLERAKEDREGLVSQGAVGALQTIRKREPG